MSFIDVVSFLNNVVSSNQALVVSLGVPLISIAVSVIATRATLGSQRSSLLHQGKMKLAEFREDRISVLRNELAALNTLVFVFQMNARDREFDKISPPLKHNEIAAFRSSAFGYISKIQLLMDPNDPESNSLREQFKHIMLGISNDPLSIPEDKEPFGWVSSRILERMTLITQVELTETVKARKK